MTPRAEDERIARKMGWQEVRHPESAASLWFGPGGGPQAVPDFLQPEGFVQLLLWHAKEGRTPALSSIEGRWLAEVGATLDLTGYRAWQPTPAAALVAATLAWIDAKEAR